jgi:cobalamin biosynthesis protein CbiG
MQVNLSLSPVLWVGIGCQKGISVQLIEKAIEKILLEYQLDDSDIAGIATVDIKASELGLKEFCQLHKLPLKTFSKETLASVCVPNPSNKITEKIGTPSVAEASAILAASQISSQVKLLVPKQIFRLADEIGSVTLAIAVIQ